MDEMTMEEITNALLPQCTKLRITNSSMLFEETLGNSTDFNGSTLMNQSCWTIESSPYTKGFKKVMDELNIYITPFIIIIGVTGNFLSFLVFTLTHLRRQSSSVYLASLAIVDIVFLCNLCIVWLSFIKISIFHQEGWCQLVVYMMYVCKFLSVWLVTSFTIDRFIFCYYPLFKERFCTTRLARIVVLLLVLCGLLVYSFLTWTHGVHYLPPVSVCLPYPQYYTVLTTISLVDAAVTLIIPCSLVIVLNIRIVLRIMSVERQRQPFQRLQGVMSLPRSGQRHSREGPGGPVVSVCHESFSSGCPVHVRFQTHPTSMDKRTGAVLSTTTLTTCSTRSRKRRSNQYRTARMLIIASYVFVLQNLPERIFYIYAFIQSSLSDEFSFLRDDLTLTLHEIFNLVYYLNFSINFFIYSAWGGQFRNGLKLLYARFQHKTEMFRMWRDRRKMPANI